MLADFLLFAKKYRHKFRQIAKATKNEHEPNDVQGEAWVLIEEWRSSKVPISFDNPQDIDRLFAFLYAKLVKHSEKNIRYAVRLDHYSTGDSLENEAHPLMNKLAASKNSQPLEILLALEDTAKLPPEPESHESRGSAYLHLLQHHNNKMKYVADHLLISLSYCYYRFNEALEMTRIQQVLPDTLGKSNNAFFPGPWRPFRLIRNEQSPWRYQPWVQTQFEFVCLNPHRNSPFSSAPVGPADPNSNLPSSESARAA